METIHESSIFFYFLYRERLNILRVDALKILGVKYIRHIDGLKAQHSHFDLMGIIINTIVFYPV